MLCACTIAARFAGALVPAQTNVEVARDWLDYVSIGGAFIGLVLAFGAILYARQSVRSARESAKSAADTVKVAGRTAEAAETTAAAAREEADHSRELVRMTREQHERMMQTPKFETDLKVDCPLGPGATVPFVLKCTFLNTGDGPARDATAYIAVPKSIEVASCGPGGQQLKPTVPLTIMEGAELAEPGGTSEMHVHSWDMRLIHSHKGHIWHGVFYFRGPGIYEIELRLVHSDAPDARDRYTIEVADNGGGGFKLVMRGRTRLGNKSPTT